MPIYEFRCSTCKKEFEDYVGKSDAKRTVSHCCNSISGRTGRLYRHRVQMGGFKGVDKAQMEKAQKHGDIDGGIPFGQVPGDSEFIDSQGRVPGDKDYLGPLP